MGGREPPHGQNRRGKGQNREGGVRDGTECRGEGLDRMWRGGRDRICGQPEKKPTFICEQEYIIIIENKSGRIKRTTVFLSIYLS